MSTLLITGATGFLGGAVLEKLLTTQIDNHYLLLVRASTPELGLQRIKENLQKFKLTTAQLDQLQPDNILLGDLAEPEHFLNDPRLNHVTRVINCAAVASFGNNPLIWKVNVEGTLAFAKRMAQVPGLQRFVHVGTAMSCAPEPDSLVIESAEFNEQDQHLVEYTRSKSMIESLMRNECPQLPLVIARPSIVVGHTNLGCTPSSSIFWVFGMALKMRQFMCSLDDRIDVIPVDYCADALLMLLMADNISEDVYHISAGEESSVTFAEIDQAISQANNEEPVGKNYVQVTYESMITMRHQFKDLFGPCNERLMLKAIRLYGSFAMLNVRFSNKKILSLGMPHPPRFTEYVDRCVKSTHHLSIPQQMTVDFK